jgi:hypothetical protein
MGKPHIDREGGIGGIKQGVAGKIHDHGRVLPAEVIGIGQAHPSAFAIFAERGMKCGRRLDCTVFPDTPDGIALHIDWGEFIDGKLLGRVQDHVEGLP